MMTTTKEARAKRIAVDRIVGFAKQFGEEHLNLACHAAFPLALTPDLLYQIWAHFVPRSPWTAVARVLLSRLCREVGYEMYEMDIAVRNLLLKELKEQFGQERFEELAEFLIDYVAQRLNDDDPETQDLAQVQEWTALAYTKPELVASELEEALKLMVKQKDMAEVFRLASLVETFAEPLKEAGFEPLLVYAGEISSFVRSDMDRYFYLDRPDIEEYCYEFICEPQALIRIKGPHQMGKTCLMTRVLDRAAKQGYRTVRLDFNIADNSVFTDLNKLIRWFCFYISRALQMSPRLDDYWHELLGSKSNCTNYLKEYILAQINSPLVLGLDEVDRLLAYPDIALDFLSLLRVWHERGKSEGNDGKSWGQLRLIMAQATEIYTVLSLDIKTSPFNVGLPVELPEFTPQQVQTLAKKYKLDWTATQVEKLMTMVGGHPYLVQQALTCIRYRNISLEQLLQTAPTAAGIYNDHLRQQLFYLKQHPELEAAFIKVVNTPEPVRIDTKLGFQLHSIGLIKIDGNKVIPRCNLYRLYFRDLLI